MSGNNSNPNATNVASGFDAVIGNPPYVRQEMLGASKPYFAKKYKVYHGMADLYSYFFERGINLLQPSQSHNLIPTIQQATSRHSAIAANNGLN